MVKYFATCHTGKTDFHGNPGLGNRIRGRPLARLSDLSSVTISNHHAHRAFGHVWFVFTMLSSGA